eukprot:CAMPEP_0202702146 /NCGR_PEP_ID=MMETSP1385-20130828/15171_1 /ASSEMBLY_ACC=CAM_ASM_000861 /TAXON_ID=933848 /ORGANISM="Elphidium margaritaceum" /LENGTH=726 /DNA_ID=CAMNT_0049359735 /DNA_START=77 /DNA_END=2257 /DNA_ORIENTATION=-
MAIQVRSVSDYNLVWCDKGSGGRHDGSFWRASLPRGYCLLGDTGVAGYAAPESSTIVVANGNDADALRAPTDYAQVWNDSKSGAHWDGSFWAPIPPPGYIACGTVAMRSHSKPPLDLVRCVKESYVEQGVLGGFIWNDEKTGARHDFGAWNIVANSGTAVSLGTFYANSSHSPDPNLFSQTTGHVLKISAMTFPGPLSVGDLHAAIAKYGPMLRLHPEERYLPTCVEYFAEHGLLQNKQTGETKDLNLDEIPTGPDSGAQYQLKLKDAHSRNGDFNRAVCYVHAQTFGQFHTDVQFWFFHAYNGPGTARIKSLLFDTTTHAGNPSMAPLGEHEGDWEHVTLRLSNASHQPEQMCYYQHGDAHWIPFAAAPKAGTQPVVYSSKNGHASYWTAGANYTEHRKVSIGLAGLEFFLRNDTADGGQTLDCSKRYQLVDASYLGKQAPPRPRWVDFTGRWGASLNAPVDEDMAHKVLVAALGPILGNIPVVSALGLIVGAILPLFAKEDQDGPMAPITDKDWQGMGARKTIAIADDEKDGDDEKEGAPTRSTVRYSSRIKLMHVGTRGVLHSHHSRYPEGSKQQQVTAYSQRDDNDWFMVKRGFSQTPLLSTEHSQSQAQKVKYHDVIQLQHVATAAYLHSHDFKSAVSKQQEVSCYAGLDGNNNWKLVLASNENSTDFWRMGDKVNLIHCGTNQRLHSHKLYYPDWGFRQQEVTCYGHRDHNDNWLCQELI